MKCVAKPFLSTNVTFVQVDRITLSGISSDFSLKPSGTSDVLVTSVILRRLKLVTCYFAASIADDCALALPASQRTCCPSWEEEEAVVEGEEEDRERTDGWSMADGSCACFYVL